jgi:hypothetical protein
MSPTGGLSHHPAPHAERLSRAHIAFILCGGPAAWFIQLLLGVWLTSWPCFPHDQRLAAPLGDYGWSGVAAMVIVALCALVAGAAGLAGHRALRLVIDEESGKHEALAEIGHGRTRFISLWSVALGYGAAIAAILTFAAFLLVPRCAG